ncbi:Retrovirus-related Pol polyprotein from transposon 17.6 [Vitis vinifera]|uniref:Retrovirus-related Pol polyprotein from transposon 17.6 n=1 Tax=Vitis vinifera TaxID=29760 RepID=A0A438FGG1_VITVI|nr:Retrovirus-related Pol polyprotein from transposon 17.6 [Vitis vinifera]
MEATPKDQHSHQGRQDNLNEFRSMRDRMHPPRMSAPSCIVAPTEQLVIRPYLVPLLPTFHGMESENPYAHIKEFEDDKAKIWLNSLRPRSIRSWTNLQAEFLKKFFPTHRTNGLKRQISNFSAKENEKFYECWERYMEAINACPHHGFDTWLLVSYFYDGMSSSMKQLLETMRSGKDEVSTECFQCKGWDVYLEEDDDMKAKLAAMTRRLEELELKRIHEVQVVAEAPVQVKLCPNCKSYEHLVEECPAISAEREMFTLYQIALGKNHFPLPFIDQVLERVSGDPFYCFLDGYSGYFQIEIDVADQEKTIFTCPFGTYAYRRMPFGLCNAPATFQRCMLSIFSDMVERIMEVFMYDITVYGGSFEECLVNLEAVLHRCIEKDLVLNWEKCHFMVRQGIVLGHIISEKGIEVDKAKVELIVKLPSPTTVKGVRQFLGHAGFYRRFIKGVVLGQREDGKPYVIYYASKTLNEAQRNYTTTEKELLAVVFALDKFRAYLVGSFIIVFTDHSALKSDFIRKCVPEDEQQGILSHCHENACGGHFASHKTAMKVLQSGFTWPSLFKDAHIMCRSCDRCQRLGKLTKRNQMPMNPILIVELFDVWGIDFMGPFPMSFGNSYILVGVDYVSKWVEAIPCKQNDHRVVLKFLKEEHFLEIGIRWLHLIILFGQVELANREIKNILMKVVNSSRKDWSIRLHDSLWAYRTAYKTILGMSPIVLSMAKHHLPVEVEYKAWWAIKKLNMDLIRAGEKRYLDLNEMEELRNDAYINSKVAKQRMKKWHDQLISNKEFQKGQRVLLYDTRLHIFPGSSSGRNAKKLKKKIGAKSEQTSKTEKNRLSRLQPKNFCERALCCQTIPQHFGFSARIFAAAKASLAHECHFAAQEPHFAAAKRLRSESVKIPDFATKVPFRRGFKIERAILADCSSPLSPTAQASVIFSGHPFRPNFGNPKWREPEGQVFLSFKRKKSARGARSTHLEPPRRKQFLLRRDVISPGQGSATAKEARVESSNPLI